MRQKRQTGRPKVRFLHSAKLQNVRKFVQYGRAYIWRGAKKATKLNWLSLLKAISLIADIVQKIRTLITYKQPQIICLTGITINHVLCGSKPKA